MNAEQPALFTTADDDLKPPPPRVSRSTPPTRGRGKTRSKAGHPAVVTEVLTELEYGRYGLHDQSDTVVIFEDHDRIRVALDGDAVLNLIQQGYAERCPARDEVWSLHGVVRKPVVPLRLTKRGRTLLMRWTALKPLGEEGK